ncbi:hemerythrin domain-containing protein [Membranihabitans marinus]|uniref:hemerythrin domain-containing protein n=1 Tax=Membranihabitans marinus TaxID=1227546 RepID=UPI001F3FC5B9|nr:hemerythrin domain-containing protein [Membranihabitans marinus]
MKTQALQHHHGLFLCWNIKTGLLKNIDLYRIKKYADWFYNHQLNDHFRLEEELLFPILGLDNKWVIQALDEHSRLRSLFESEDQLDLNLNLIVKELDRHIQMEEDVLFPEIQKNGTVEQLQVLEDIHKICPEADEWEDRFWELEY